jgi:O-antigen ligase
MWRHYPWLFGLILAPLVHGGTSRVGQLIVASLACLSLLLLRAEFQNPSGSVPAACKWLLAFALIVQVIPLPASLVGVICPERLALAKEFPVGPGAVPHFLTLTVSPALTLTRLWQFAVCITIFCLARAAARELEGARTLTLFLGVGVGLVAASDLWNRMRGYQAFPASWEILPGRDAGTFNNRNLFAVWIVAASLFIVGRMLRAWFPLLAARGLRTESVTGGRAESLLLFPLVVFALVMAVRSGSRGAAIALGVGSAVWMALLALRSKRRGRLAVIIFALVLLVCLIIAFGGNVVSRFGDARADFLQRYPKKEIWSQSLGIFARFPVFGTGWGSFLHAFNHYKSSGGDFEFRHAENDYVQTLVESGLLGVIACGAVLFFIARRAANLVLCDRCSEPESAFGAFAGLLALATLAMLDFPAQNPATALLAAVLAGFLFGSADARAVGVVYPLPAAGRVRLNIAWAAALALSIAPHAVALHHVSEGERERDPQSDAAHFRSALHWWPLLWPAQLDLTRNESVVINEMPQSARGERVEAVFKTLDRTLALDPLNVRLRKDRVRFHLNCRVNLERAEREALETCRLAPLDMDLPFEFARDFSTNDPPFAASLLERLPPSERNLSGVLALAWQFEHNASALWRRVPDTVPGHTALADFAFEHKLYPLAANAWSRLSNYVDAATIANKLIVADRSVLAFDFIRRVPDGRERRLLEMRAHLGAGDFFAATAKAEEFWLARAASREFLAPYPANLTLEAARADWLADQKNLIKARRLGEKIFQQPATGRDLNLLKTLAGTFPADLRLTWLTFSTQRDLRKTADAAATAVDLAIRSAARE